MAPFDLHPDDALAHDLLIGGPSSLFKPLGWIGSPDPGPLPNAPALADPADAPLAIFSFPDPRQSAIHVAFCLHAFDGGLPPANATDGFATKTDDHLLAFWSQAKRAAWADPRHPFYFSTERMVVAHAPNAAAHWAVQPAVRLAMPEARARAMIRLSLRAGLRALVELGLIATPLGRVEGVYRGISTDQARELIEPLAIRLAAGPGGPPAPTIRL